jgi:hypothetical protein
MHVDLINKHEGQMAFVLGSGPSLRHVDMELLKPHVTIAVNSSIVAAPFADYFMTCEHGLTLFKSWQTLKHLDCKILLHELARMNFFREITGIDAWNGISPDRLEFFQFAAPLSVMMKQTEKLIRGSSSVHSAIHFAYILGCSPIVLLGCDCEIEDDKYHFYDFPGPLQYSEGYLRPEFEQLKPMYSFPVKRTGDTDEILLGHEACWETIRGYNPDVNIINASGGRLDVWPRMTLEEIFLEMQSS